MQTTIIGIVLIIVSLGVDVWLGTALASGSPSDRASRLAFVLFSLPFLAVGIYFLLSSRGEIKAESKADKERTILNSVMTRGKVSIPDLAIEGNLTRDQVKDYIYDLIGKDLFRGYVNWDRGEMVSAEAAQIKDGTCPNCGGKLELAGKGLVRCPFCGTETYLSPAARAAPAPAPVPRPGCSARHPRRRQPARRRPRRAAPPPASAAHPTGQCSSDRGQRATEVQAVAGLSGPGLRRRPCPPARRGGRGGLAAQGGAGAGHVVQQGLADHPRRRAASRLPPARPQRGRQPGRRVAASPRRPGT